MEQDSLARSPAKLNQTNRLLVCVSLLSVHTYFSLLCLHSNLFFFFFTTDYLPATIHLYSLVLHADFYLMSVRLSKTLRSLVKRWPWDVFPGALWCFKEHFYLAGKSAAITERN